MTTHLILFQLIIDDAVIKAIEKCIPLGPLHNPANLMGIRACQAVMPNTPQVAVFDTAFHMTMPPKAYRYAIPTEYYENDEYTTRFAEYEAEHYSVLPYNMIRVNILRNEAIDPYVSSLEDLESRQRMKERIIR